MLSADALTPEQQSIVHHGQGPALVLAVPGAGKTTTLVHRIRVLVTEQTVSPGRILVCSFNRDTVDDLSEALAALDVRRVDVRTLHSLGHQLLPATQAPDQSASRSPSAVAHRLARRALQDLADEQGVDPEDLKISPSDLVDRVAAWKQQLAYADLEAASLPSSAHDTARQAAPQNEDLLRLYGRFEAHRHRENLRTYPDMLRDGWERLMQDDSLRTRAQNAYEYVLIDEFQDVSRAQFEILDCLTAGDRNYMVVGDDDQCIYQWRGAHPSFLRAFADRYNATTYRLTTSFRLPAAPLVLANTAIPHNDERQPKQMRLTTGVDGTARCVSGADVSNVADQLAETVRALHTDHAYDLSEMVVLVRRYGQTPPLERAFIDRDLPYHIRGRSPFYRRSPVQTLLRYLHFAVLERRRRSRNGFADGATARQCTERFAQISNHPNRYIRREWIDVVCREALDQKTSPLDRAEARLDDLSASARENADTFLTVLRDLVERLDANAGTILRDLANDLEYEQALRDRRVPRERGEEKGRTVTALYQYADQFNSAPALLHGVKTLAEARESRSSPREAVDLRSIHRAKGAEWPVVFVPGCVEGTLPHTPEDCSAAELEEERRLFYVALTRTQERLYLGVPESDERSRFLDDAAVDTQLPLCRAVRHGLTAEPATLSDADLANLCRGLIELGLEDYIRNRWTPPPDRLPALQQRLNALQSVVDEAQQRRADYRAAQAKQDQHRSALRSEVDERMEELRKKLGATVLSAAHDADNPSYPDDGRFTFRWTDDETQVAVYWRDEQVGTLNPLDAGTVDPNALLSLPWEALIGRFEDVKDGRDSLRITIDWIDTREHLLQTRRSALDSPDPPADLVQTLTDASFEAGYGCLRERLDDLTSRSS